MRLLSIANHFPPGYTGGAEVVNLFTMLGLMARGFTGSVLTLNNMVPHGGDRRYGWEGIPVREVHVASRRHSALLDLFDPRLYRATLDELRRVRPDIVHVHNVAGATLAPFVACQRLGIPVVNTLHDLWLLCPNNMRLRRDNRFCDPRHFPDGCGACSRRFMYWGDVPRRRLLLQRLTQGVGRFISPSQALIERHVEAGYERQRFRLARHGFPIEPPTIEGHPDLVALLAEPTTHPTIFFAGGGVEPKGAAVVAEMLPLLLSQRPDLRILVAGGGDAALLARMRQHGPAVQLLGPIPHQAMLALFALADLTLVPSIWHENLPVVISESYQVGTPVVGSAIGGIPELIEEGQTGYLFPVGDAAALAACILYHLGRPAPERRRMRLRCVARVQRDLTEAGYLDTIEAIYAEVLGG